MSGPGKGRYTTYVPVSSDRNTRLWKLFNKNAPEDAGVFYGGQEPSNNDTAAAAAVARATAPVVKGVGGLFPSSGNQAGDQQMFPNGVNLKFNDAPNLRDVKWMRPGDPANSFVPDISSPGPKKTLGTDKNVNPKIKTTDIKENYAYDNTNTPPAGEGTASPSDTSTVIGNSSPIGVNLISGKSSI